MKKLNLIFIAIELIALAIVFDAYLKIKKLKYSDELLNQSTQLFAEAVVAQNNANTYKIFHDKENEAIQISNRDSLIKKSDSLQLKANQISNSIK